MSVEAEGEDGHRADDRDTRRLHAERNDGGHVRLCGTNSKNAVPTGRRWLESSNRKVKAITPTTIHFAEKTMEAMCAYEETIQQMDADEDLEQTSASSSNAGARTRLSCSTSTRRTSRKN